MTKPQRLLGITVLGDFILSEGIKSVLENLHKAGATAVATNPTVTAPADENTGSFQPPIDAGSSPRVFDRSLFGKNALWVRSGVSYEPRADLYADSSYAPRKTNDLTEAHGHIIRDFIKAAVDSGLKVFLQIGAAQPSGLRDEDRPRLPNGEIGHNRMADTASLASEAVRAYNRAYIRDLLEEFPEVSGFRPDWPEYPCYTLGEVFQDFSPHVANWSESHGFDFEAVRAGVGEFWDFLHGGVTNSHLEQLVESDRGQFALHSWLRGFPAVAEWLRLKSALSIDMVQAWRSAIDDAGRNDLVIGAHAFMPTYSHFTGIDFGRTAELCESVSPKLYTMHWSLMVKFWGDEILAHNDSLDESLLVRALVNLMDIADDEPGTSIEDYGYPHPDEPHPIPDGPQQRKIRLVKAATAGNAEVSPLVHGYGPLDDFTRRLQLVANEDIDGLWINRYGYLSDEKLSAIGSVFA